ncbi:MAG: hypothetical protein ACI8RD_003702 [Bacillariaceae sp.]|jgi:hypothetical protein
MQQYFIQGIISASSNLPRLSIKKQTTASSSIGTSDVVCARGRAHWDHPGNALYRKLIGFAKNQYSMQNNRIGKSQIVSEIIDAVHNSNGRFIKKVGKGKSCYWVECDENFIREKVTQSLRDGLSFKYSSSTKRKRERKAKVQEVCHGDIHMIIHSNINISRKINSFKQYVEYSNRVYGTDVSDETILSMFDPANLDLLESIKKDRSLLDQLHGVTNNSNSTSSSSSAAAAAAAAAPSASASATATTTNYIAYHRRDHLELSFSSSAIPSEPPLSVLHASFSSSSTSASSAYTTASSLLSTTMVTAAATVQYDLDECNDEVFLDLDTAFMFLDEM